jgi:hypothetical protein
MMLLRVTQLQIFLIVFVEHYFGSAAKKRLFCCNMYCYYIVVM